jgi:CheY-like chemotaxis protein
MTIRVDDAPILSDAPRLGGVIQRLRSGNEPELSGARAHIVVLDDYEAETGLLKTLLELMGYRITSIANGNLALPVLMEMRPALFITDIQHPGMDTASICKYIRADPGLSDLPIILYTACPFEECEPLIMALNLAHMFKPVALEDMLKLIARAIGRKQ